MPQLDPTWFASQLFWLFVSFAVLYTVLSRVILPPLMGVMTQRKDTVTSDLAHAQQAKEQAEQAKELYERTLAEARARSQQLLNDAMLEQKAQAEAAHKKLEDEIAAKLRESERRIAAKKQELMVALTPATAELTALIVEKLTQQASSDNGNSGRLASAGGMSKAGR